MTELKIEYVNTSDLTPYDRNARTHSKKQVRQIAKSIQEFGFTNPILTNADGEIIAGHGRLLAAEFLKIPKVPVVRVDHMTREQIRAYVIADNRLAELAGWDQEILALELQELTSVELDLDLTVTGFEASHIEVLIDGIDEETPEPPVEITQGPAVTRLGDIWCIGPHRLICGDATDPKTYDALMGERKAQMVFSDPPYNVAIHKNVCGSGRIKHREFGMGSGEMTPADFTRFLKTSFELQIAHSVAGALHYVCMDWRHMNEIQAAGQVFTELKNLCVWTKDNAGMGSFYRSQHELIYVYRSGSAAAINNIKLGTNGRNRSNVWAYPGANGFGEGRETLALHPTVKPKAMVADAIKDCTHKEHLVLDPFAGAGTTLLAAHDTGRDAYAIELDPLYCDVAIRRLEEATGLEATLEATSETFAERLSRAASTGASTTTRSDATAPHTSS